MIVFVIGIASLVALGFAVGFLFTGRSSRSSLMAIAGNLLLTGLVFFGFLSLFGFYDHSPTSQRAIGAMLLWAPFVGGVAGGTRFARRA